MNSQQTKIFQDFVQDSLRQSLPDLNLVRVDDPEQGDPVQWLDPIHVSIMRFQGDGMQGNAILGCDLGFLQRTCPHFKAGEGEHMMNLQDWIGELSNLILGRLKNKLLPFGPVLKLNPPSVSESTGKIFDLYATHSENFRLWFTSERDYICLSFSLDVNESVDLRVTSNQEEGQLQPGDAIYRLNEIQSRKPSDDNIDMISKVRSGVASEESPERSLAGIDYIDDIEPERLYRARAEDQVPSWTQKSPALIDKGPRREPESGRPEAGKGGEASRGPLPALSRTEPEAPHAGARRLLEAMEWQPQGELILRFQGGVDYTLVPQKLLAEGLKTITVEGFQFELSQNGRGIRVNVLELQMSIEQGFAA